jgi:regulator of PEP synthase PpsR (kinase-PPPase family)
MMNAQRPTLYVVSGGVGASGEQLLYTVLAQFPGTDARVTTHGNIRHMDQIERIVRQVKETGGIVVHTLVESHLRRGLIKLAQEQGVIAIDLVGPLIEHLAALLDEEPAEQPGLYRKLKKAYFERIESIEFTMAHDDGKNPPGWSNAEIVITGVSRVGKTPLSMYLSVLGWKVANVPIIVGVEPAPELFKLDPRRVIGLKIEPGQLLFHRQARQSRIGAPGQTGYTDPQAVYEEVEYALRLFKRRGFTIIDVTDKPVETTADEVIRVISRLEDPNSTASP